MILRGVQTAASINLVATLAKLLPLGLFVVLAMMMFKLDTFKLDFTGLALGVPVWEQVKNTMLITLWVSLVWKVPWLFLRVRVISVMLAKRHCWRFSPLWAFICW